MLSDDHVLSPLYFHKKSAEMQDFNRFSVFFLQFVVMTNSDGKKRVETPDIPETCSSKTADDPTSLVALDLAPRLSSRDLHHILDGVGGSRETAADTLVGSNVPFLVSTFEITSSAAECLLRAFSTGQRAVANEERGRRDVGIDLIPLGSPRYPESLSVIPDPPLLLRCLGTPSSAALGLAIVGSRRPSDYGVRLTPEFVRACSDSGVSVVSGGARGIDGIAHRAAVRDGVPTLAVLANGLRMLYPPEHGQLFQSIVDGGGALVSETSVFAPPRPWLFPRRNRIISGLSLGVLVMEAAVRSGALITARLAVEEHGRDVLAVPGRIGDRMSEGCLRMLEEGWAGVARSPKGAVAELLRGRSVESNGHS